jgi:hypothetical protein
MARATSAASFLGAPLALACQDALGVAALPRAELLRQAQIAAVSSRHARRGMLALVSALEENSIPAGLASAYSLYSAPYLRLLPDADILIHAHDLPALCAILQARIFSPSPIRHPTAPGGALTTASFAPVTPRESGAYYIDFHRLVIDYPACRGVPTAEIFTAARHLETEHGMLSLPSVAHSFVILALHAFRDFYEPRGLNALFDAALLVTHHQPN